MNAALIAAVISAAAAVIIAVLSSAFTRWQQREADWRKLKIEIYKEYLVALSDAVGVGATQEAQDRYAKATNVISLVAPAFVLEALYSFNDHIRLDKEVVFRNALLTALRRDLYPNSNLGMRNIKIRLHTARPTRPSYPYDSQAGK